VSTRAGWRSQLSCLSRQRCLDRRRLLRRKNVDARCLPCRTGRVLSSHALSGCPRQGIAFLRSSSEPSSQGSAHEGEHRMACRARTAEAGAFMTRRSQMEGRSRRSPTVDLQSLPPQDAYARTPGKVRWLAGRRRRASACQLPAGSSPCTSLSANSSIMLRSYTRFRPRRRVTKQEMAAVSGVGIGSGPRV
jgi:hypothetical protein